MKRLLQKAVTIKSFKYLSLGSALKKQTSIAEKVENQRFHDDLENWQVNTMNNEQLKNITHQTNL